ncbi:hypothetical protein CTI12_AA332470 [Artemisia annua]|uniref:YTH domain-containing protein n=1 Tax=Artemisia annua TaxID=35608 RepID=A0A2U1MWL6_ARTAN|nr:hypothetical protein CTI12_AA332470 [Artemisia annua]
MANEADMSSWTNLLHSSSKLVEQAAPSAQFPPLQRNLDQLEALSKKLKSKTLRTEAPSQSIAATRLLAREGINAEQLARDLKSFELKTTFEDVFPAEATSVEEYLQQSCAACYPGGVAKGYQPNPNFASLAYQNKALFASYSTPHAPKVRESEELTCGPRSQSSMSEHQESKHSLKDNQYNLDGFQTNYEHAKFYIIKSYSEDDVHKCVKYDVWSSTLNGNKKLDAAFLGPALLITT